MKGVCSECGSGTSDLRKVHFLEKEGVVKLCRDCRGDSDE